MYHDINMVLHDGKYLEEALTLLMSLKLLLPSAKYHKSQFASFLICKNFQYI